ncbi:MAG: hypothetical protein ABII21_01150 [bacterium]
MKKILVWLDNHLLLTLTAILIVVIPAYPKLPLADLIEGYIVRLRLEDIAILISLIFWFVQLIRKKISFPKNIISKLIIAYLVIGFLSTLSALFLTHTVPLERQHIFKLYFHFFRRVEYFSLFFITYSAIKTKKDIKLLLLTSFATLLAVVLYGFGQKYLFWPAFSTMNREFSKGMRLYLTPNSRVMSTFAGHYDYGAYLMMALSFLISFLWVSRSFKQKLLVFLLLACTYWSLILTASRTSFIGYLAGITAITFIMGHYWGRWRAFGNWFVAIFLSLIVMLTMGDLSARFFQVLETPDILIHQITQLTPLQRDSLTKFRDGLLVKAEAMREPLLKFKNTLASLQINLNNPFKKSPPKNSISTDDAAVSVASDTPPTPDPPADLPPDVTAAEDAFRKSQEATPTAVVSTSGYSPNALKYGLSVAIRLDALWPRAMAGFKKNPLLGSGYSTLTKATNEEFTVAESTDNDYLRMLGETGLLGTLTFLAIPLAFIYFSFQLFRRSQSILEKTFTLGLLGAVIALFVNASYIDVFESSKIAYLLWFFGALIIRLAELTLRENKS